MVWKKLAFPEQYFSPRRKVISGFGLGIGVSIVVLGVLLFSNSLKSPTVEPSIQGFYSVGLNSGSVSWPFSFSSSSGSSFSHRSSTSETQESIDLEHKIEEGRVLNRTHEANYSVVAGNSNFVEPNGKGTVLENTHFQNFTEEVKDRSFVIEDEKNQQKNSDNGSLIPEKGKVLSSNGGGTIVEIAHLGNSSELLKNGSLHGEEGRVIGNFSLSDIEDVHAEKTIEGSLSKNSSNEDDKVTENKRKKSVRETAHLGNSKEKNKIIDYDSQLRKMQTDSYQKCDIFFGKWVRDDSKPYYPGGSCPYIDRDFNCQLNGRPDNAFIKWKWQPNECDIPSLNATDFLERLRGKRLVFVGDSLNRNMWESLVCILRNSLRYKRRVHEISGKSEFKKKGFYAFRFEDYNCSVDFVASPFLVRESSFTGQNGSFETLRLDMMDRTTSMYHDADVIVFNTGHWWTHEKTSKGEDYYQEGNYVHPRLKVLEAYKRALTTWARWVDKNIDVKRTQVFFRGYSVTHFSGGQWNSGGQCHKEAEPIFNETYLGNYPSKMRALEHVLQEMKTPVTYLNISKLTDYRKDGHPSIYRMKYKTVEEQITAEQSQDCSHWCLPGVPDTWNELLYASLLKARRASVGS
ncbi:hypothetical protein PRUPE_1G249700 [Prunus persica]|uniref:Uncharacterized protein n=1 Tax=Prunus persica TaxID=3760 RepID=M5XCL2_PRUPE|nr:protein trichome birefringence-like 2 [Prunus persica]ONI30409.1 hypothetical protein PRUPE_1G249700 [Prunus persica]ONI30410.1 hypothetical protein PRUPE_1G249700 [Prunus persica]ONI30411.1 hypothetical protein PRUPE_1G249700 [Prunus persica]